MLENGMGVGEGSAKMRECKQDYEADINSAKEMLKKAENLRNALFDYVGYTSLRGPLAELVGELVSKERQTFRNIEMLIAAQEKEQVGE